MSARRIAPVVLFMVALVACGTPKRLTPDEYYREATDAFADENYQVAIQQYNELLDQFPFDPRAEEAELHIAESHYEREAYPEAIAALSDFQRMHPMSPHLARVYYLLGESYMDQMTTIDRDQGASENAHAWYRVVIDRYPDSEYAEKAKAQMAECREELAGHELYIAEFYFDRDNTRAGENRIKGVLDVYADTEVATEALERLADAYEGIDDTERAGVVREALAARAARPALDGTLTLDSPAGHALRADLDARYGPTVPIGEEQPVATLREPAPADTAASATEPDFAPGVDRGSRAY